MPSTVVPDDVTVSVRDPAKRRNFVCQRAKVAWRDLVRSTRPQWCRSLRLVGDIAGLRLRPTVGQINHQASRTSQPRRLLMISEVGAKQDPRRSVRNGVGSRHSPDGPDWVEGRRLRRRLPIWRSGIHRKAVQKGLEKLCQFAVHLWRKSCFLRQQNQSLSAQKNRLRILPPQPVSRDTEFAALTPHLKGIVTAVRRRVQPRGPGKILVAVTSATAFTVLPS
jgi:hypothetical protein